MAKVGEDRRPSRGPQKKDAEGDFSGRKDRKTPDLLCQEEKKNRNDSSGIGTSIEAKVQRVHGRIKSRIISKYTRAHAQISR